MKKITNDNCSLFLVMLFFVYGGNSDANAADTNTVFCSASIAANSYRFFSPHCWAGGASHTYNLRGTSPNGKTSFTSQFIFTKKNNTTYQGVSVSQFDLFFSLTNQAAAATGYTTSVYARTDTGVTLAQVYGDTTCTVVNGSIKIPAFINDGDSGTAYSFNCSDGTSTTATWTANIDKASRNIMYALTSVARDQSGNVYVKETDTYYLNTEGIPQRIDSQVKMGGSILYNMSSN